MTNTSSKQAGFSAVELLITLFVAAAFIITGYQLYSIVIKDGSDARRQAKASNVAYQALRTYAAQATNPCTVVTPSPAPTIPSGSGLPNPAITVTFSCPYGASNTAISKVAVKVTYDSPQKEVDHAIFVSN